MKKQKRKRESIIQTGISICTVCMNRNHHLLQSLPTWLNTNVDEIVIVDWGSQTLVQDTISEFLKDNRIKLFRISNVKKWILSTSFNFSIRQASFNKILKLDVDNMITPDFFDFHQLKESEFYSGNWRFARDENERHTNGIVYMFKADFINIYGYNELLISYGYDDCDLYFRLSKLAIKLVIDYDKISHIQHTDEERTGMQDSKEKLDVGKIILF